MAKGKRRRPQHLLALLLIFGLLLGMLPGGIAEAGAVEANASPESLALEGGAATVVYLDGTSGEDTNSGADKDHAVKSLGKAFELATAGEIKTDPSANAVILVCGQTTFGGSNFNIPASGVKEKALWPHVGTLTLTSKYGGEDYSSMAALSIVETSSDQFMQMGGPTVFDNMTWDLSGSSAAVRFYVGTSFKVTESVTIKGATSNNSLFVSGGWVRVDEAEDVDIQLLGGTYGMVSPVTYNASHGWVTGDCNITIGSNAEVMKLQAGPFIKKSKTNTINKVTVTLEKGAKVGTYCAGSADGNFGTVTESTLVLKGGDAPQVLSAFSGSVGNTTLELSGVTGEFTLSGSWTKLVVKDSSDVEMLDKLAADLVLDVEAGSKLTLAAEDTHEHTGEGQVIPYPHVWVEEPGKKWSPHAALMAQSIISAVIARGRERRPCLWPNTVCQAGYAASAAAETTRST